MSQQQNSYALFSDGGSSSGNTAAAACILEGEESGVRTNLVAFLGAATNNEAEIFASLMGFAVLAQLEKSLEKLPVRWVADSEYVLKSATGYINQWQKNGWKTADKKPVKNQGLWRSYLALTKGLKIAPEHVRGHTGHPENEACDAALNWAKSEGPELLMAKTKGRIVEIDVGLGIESWIVVDASSSIEALREEHPEEADIEGIAQLFIPFLSAPKSINHEEQKRLQAAQAAEIAPAIEYLRKAQKVLSEITSQNRKASQLKLQIDELIKKTR